MFLVDTNVLSVAAPSRKAAPSELVAWMAARERELYLSVVSVTEIEGGFAKLERRGDGRPAATLSNRLNAVIRAYAARLLPFDLPAARLAGRLTDLARGRGQAPGFADVAIAATAATRSLTVLTRNLRHFAPLGVPCLDPFAALPPDRAS